MSGCRCCLNCCLLLLLLLLLVLLPAVIPCLQVHNNNHPACCEPCIVLPSPLCVPLGAPRLRPLLFL